MYATILKSQSFAGTRFTIVVDKGTDKQVFTRVGNSKGIRWEEVPMNAVSMFASEPTSSTAGLKQLTVKDVVKLSNGESPTVLLQKMMNIADTVSDDPSTYTRTLGEALGLASVGVVASAVAQTPPPVAVVVPEVEVAPPAPPVVTPVAPTVIESKETAMPIITQHTAEGTPISVPPREDYIERQFFGKSERNILDYARSTQQNVLYTGPAGTGKSSSVRNYAHHANLPMVTIECTQQIDQGITQGRFVPTGNGNETKWLYSQLATAIQQPSVILLNELTRMSPKSASLFLRLLQERELLIEPRNEVIKVHPECLIIADQNTGNGYTGTSKQDAALVDRFNIKLEFDYDADIERKFIPSETLLEFATAIRIASNMSDQFSIPMSTRILKNFVAQARGLGFEFAVNSMLANYPAMDGEREALKMRFDANLDKIAEELGVDLGTYTK